MDNSFLNWVKLSLILDKATHTLRRVFCERWQRMNGEQWPNNQQAATRLIQRIREEELLQSSKDKQQQIKSGDINRWDILTMKTILNDFDYRSALDSNDCDANHFISQVEKQREMIKTLCDFRNHCEHEPNKQISDEKFEEYWVQSSSILIEFGDTKQEIESIKTMLKLSDHDIKTMFENDECYPKAKQLCEQADQLFRDGNYDKAIYVYSEAIDLNGLNNYYKAEIFCKRSETYLKQRSLQKRLLNDEMFRLDSNDNRYLALSDAKQIILLRPSWWKGYYQRGLVYKSTWKFKKAVLYFDRSHFLDPKNDSITIERDYARFKSGQPKFKTKMIYEAKCACGYRDLLEESEKYSFDKNDLHAANIEREFSKWFKKERTSNKVIDLDPDNACDAYYLGLVKIEDEDTKKRIYSAIDLFRKGASQNINEEKFCPGVALCNYMLGIIYENGIGVEKSGSNACEYYENSFKNGCATAACNIGLMYLNGSLVERNVKKAEEYFILGADENCTDSMFHLMNLKLEETKIDEALDLFYKIWNAGEYLSLKERKEFFRKVEATKKLHNYDSYDKRRENGLEKDDIKACEKLSRFFGVNDRKIQQHLISKIQNEKCSEFRRCSFDHLIKYKDELLQCAGDGSIMAERLIKAISIFEEAKNALEKYQNNQNINNGKILIHKLAKALSSEDCIQAPESFRDSFDVIRCIIRAEGRSQLDIDARICYSYFIDSNEERKIFLELCISKYPNEFKFVEMLVTTLFHLNKFSEAYEHIKREEKRKKLSENLFYLKARTMRLLSCDIDESIKAFEDFIQEAPEDHPNFPNADYSITKCILCKDKDGPNRNQIMTETYYEVKKFYDRGLEAESKQLPSFLPYKSTDRIIVENILDFIKSQLNLVPKKVDKQVKIKKMKLNRDQLKQTKRVETIVLHRKDIKEITREIKKGELPFVGKPFDFSKMKMKIDLKALKEITLIEIDRKRECVYENCLIEFTLIELPLVFPECIQTVVEDKNGDVAICRFYKIYKNDYNLKDTFGIGCRIEIMNPHLFVFKDGISRLIVYDKRCFYSLEEERIIDMCCYCGEENASFKCGECKTCYCKRECQVNDWKIYEHNLICKQVAYYRFKIKCFDYRRVSSTAKHHE